MELRVGELGAIAVFDLETTGIDVETDQIVTAYIGVMTPDGTVIRSKNWLVNPNIPIPDGAAAIHGITTEYAAAHGQDPREAVSDIRRLLGELRAAGVPIVAYNAKYDLTLLDRECRRNGIVPLPIDPLIVIDPFIIDKAVDGYRHGKRNLETVCAFYGVTLTGAHDAEADAVATGKLAYAVLRRVDQNATLTSVHTTQIVRAAEQAEQLQTYLRRTDPDAYCETQWPVKVFGS